MTSKRAVRSKPCPSCPYRLDAPSGLWAQEEYDKLPGYDGDIAEQVEAQAFSVFGCHLGTGQICAGWVGCHGAENLLAMRLQSRGVADDVWGYQSPVPLHPSGRVAREHGMRDVDNPDARTVSKILALTKLHQHQGR